MLVVHVLVATLRSSLLLWNDKARAKNVLLDIKPISECRYDERLKTQSFSNTNTHRVAQGWRFFEYIYMCTVFSTKWIPGILRQTFSARVERKDNQRKWFEGGVVGNDGSVRESEKSGETKPARGRNSSVRRCARDASSTRCNLCVEVHYFAGKREFRRITPDDQRWWTWSALTMGLTEWRRRAR